MPIHKKEINNQPVRENWEVATKAWSPSYLHFFGGLWSTFSKAGGFHTQKLKTILLNPLLAFECQLILQPCQVILAGTAPWLGKLSSSLTPLRKHQLRRVKSFLKLETTRVYTDETGAKRCVRAPSPKLTPITDWIWNMCLCVAVLFTLWNPSRVRPVAKIWKLPRCTLVSLACGFIPQHPM